MHARFYAPDLRPEDRQVVLPPDEGRHLLRVLRLRVGAPVRVFDGRGREYLGLVAASAGDRVTIALEHETEPAPEPRVEVTLAQALLKGDAMDGVVRDATMLGVVEIVPLRTAHVEGNRPDRALAPRLSRWRRVAVSSAKQCGRARVPAIADAVSLDACLAAHPAEYRVALVEPRGGIPVLTLDALGRGQPPGTALVCVGPEGGWAPEEARALDAGGVRLLTLGRRTLRADAAAIVGLAALQATWGEFDG